MQIKAENPQEYIKQLPEDRKKAISQLRKVILDNLPKGFAETMAYGMLSYGVPHSIYPKGYHCDPKQPLPFMSLASQKNFIALHHMGIYANPTLLEWFTSEYAKLDMPKLDMGKGCVRFKKTDQIPYELIGRLASKITPAKWIELYETSFRSKK